MRRLSLSAIFLFVLLSGAVLAADDEGPWNSGDFSGLGFRNIGPAIASGRIADFAVDPRNSFHYYVSVSAGGVWETHNAGVTYEPIFDSEGSYSIGCMTLAPTNPDVVWVGSGENNSQRSVAYGDGVYKSVDGGQSWNNMGLKRSLHIGRVIVHPADENVVFVAAMGPLWGPGGDRGVYKSVDGGENWELVFEIDENTGVVDLVMDPTDPDVLYAASYQRRRHIWTLINGGPGSGIHKTTDGGRTWTELSSGLPDVDMGRIGLAISPAAPRTVYAIIEAADDKGGFFRSTDAGESWQKMSDHVAGSPQYYNELVADPFNADRIYSQDTFLQVTEDGGKTWNRLSVRSKHVDDHALWIDPANTDHLLTGCDGGVYETFDRGSNWRFAANLPITQFYRVAVDYDEPFYNVYGGTQDNNTIGGPSRTTFGHGISNREWFFTLGGDGFEPAIDPTNPNIVYCQWQYGNLNRYDKASGENLYIQPAAEEGEVLKWNWNSALIISPHNHKRLYYACQKVFRSDDMGHSWTKISEDLTSGIDRNKLEVMDRVWGVDTVAKNNSTSFWGSIIAMSESPLQEGLLVIGTDDGIIQWTDNDGADWHKTDTFKGVPDNSYVSDVECSQFDAKVIFASFDNHKRDDFAPYVMKSTNGGKSWKSIAGNLPENGTVHSLAQDHVDADLIFAGTEFGVWFTRDGGKFWTELSAGMPTIACRDLDIQRRENDLVVATFGRGFYILDDYTPLRNLTPADLEKEAAFFPVKDALIYVPGNPIGGGKKGSQGDNFYRTDNPPFGAVFTYWLGEGPKSLKVQRKATEKELIEAEKPVYYPSWDDLREEDREHEPVLVATVRNAQGEVVRRFNAPGGKGLHRVAWDLRWPDISPVNLNRSGPSTPWDDVPAGPLAMPGTYSMTLSQRVRGVDNNLAGPVEFQTRLLANNTTVTGDFGELLAFQKEAGELQRSVRGAVNTARDAQSRLNHIRQAINDTPTLDRSLLDEVDGLETQLKDMLITLQGDGAISDRSEPTTPSITGRAGMIMWTSRDITSPPTATMRKNMEIAAGQFGPLLQELTALVVTDLKSLEDRLEAAGAPHTPGRIPVWQGK
ncbi:MAG: glycosyl hydrolase [Candidatus Krumholzibacteria bacterium]|nr:glycosyl hydrolase [Candidatus Krumholzibacteria bacterium]